MQEIFIQSFFVVVDLIRLCKDIVNLTEILNCWLEIEFLENGHYLGVLLYFVMLQSVPA